ncbi:Gfo/Idh/MocA family protein [Polaromonas sp.]|uniref:Gfo/Idh/MocA family protein n=1 Tax=Polaromonas sp. TaxID=1869339 RepID=UPI002FCA5852
MAEGLRIAVVGAGAIGRKHIELLSGPELASTIRLGAIVDPAPACTDLAREKGVPWYPDLETLFKQSQIDGVLLATPNALHLAGVLTCVGNNIPVLVEKPVSDTVASALQMAAAARSRNVPVLVGHHRRHNPILSAARKVVEQGLLGRIVAAHGHYFVRKPDSYFQQAWRTEPGGGPLIINGIHDLDSLRYILQPACGDVVRVQAMASNRTRGHAVEDTAAVVLSFDSGALVTISLSDAAVSPWSWDLTSGENSNFTCQNEDCYFITGTAGSLSVPSMQLWRSADSSQGWAAPFVVESHPAQRADPFLCQLKHFAKIIRSEELPIVSLLDATINLCVVAAIRRAVEQGTTQTIEPLAA